MKLKKMTTELAIGLIALGLAGILGIVTIVLLVLTPFIPDEIITGVITLISGGFGTAKLIKYKFSKSVTSETKTNKERP